MDVSEVIIGERERMKKEERRDQARRLCLSTLSPKVLSSEILERILVDCEKHRI